MKSWIEEQSSCGFQMTLVFFYMFPISHSLFSSRQFDYVNFQYFEVFIWYQQH